MNNLIIYHDRCPDGSAAAWCARQALGSNNCVFYPAIHGKAPPFRKVRAADKTFILDFSYGREDMEQMAGLTDLLVLDHHASAQARCHGLDFCQFDMKRSGAGMAWDHFFPGQERPWFIDYVEDRDIWKWEFGNSREALAYIDTMPKNFDTWDLLNGGHVTLGECVDKGAAICLYLTQYDEEVIEASKRLISFTDPSGEKHEDIPIINASYKGISDLVNKIATGHKFGIGWFHRNDGKYQFSVRVEENSDFDASKFASLYGGGGHKKAAGFSLHTALSEE